MALFSSAHMSLLWRQKKTSSASTSQKMRTHVTMVFAWSDNQRWSPRGHILKSLALALKVKSLALASRPQVLENWTVLGSRTALFFEVLKFCGVLEKFFGKRFFAEIARKIFVKIFFFWDCLKNFCVDPSFFWRALALVSLVLGLGLEHSRPWPRECLSSERLSLAFASDFFCVLGLGLEPCVLDSTSGDNTLWYLYCGTVHL